jgi:glyoxylase-like metal-dependent hydrolase (beta-lactamase superfamily II)
MSEARRSGELGAWREVAAGIYLAVAEPATVNLALIVGDERAVLVDAGSTPEQGRRLRAAAAEVTNRVLVGVVVTHWHYDHSFGLAAFADLETIGHESVAGRLRSGPARRQATELGFDPAELGAPGRSIAVAAALDLGGRRVEIAHLGRGHTAGDLVVVVPEADVIFAGDLIESAGAPWFGEDSFPEEWAATLDGVLGLMTARSRAVPGHGDLVDREFVFDQRGRIAAVAGELARLAELGIPPERVLAEGRWPFPAENVADGVLAAYVRRPPTVRRHLPLA